MIKKTYNRIIELSDDHKQITLPDSRYYRRHGEYYPSVTYVLQAQAPDDLTVRRGDWVYADLSNQTVDGWYVFYEIFYNFVFKERSK